MRLPTNATPPRRQVLLDGALAMLLGGLTVFLNWQTLVPSYAVEMKLHYLFGTPLELRWRAYLWLAAIVAEVAVLPLRHRLPVPVLAVTIAMAVAHSALLPVLTPPSDLAVAVAAFSVAAVLPRLASAGLVVGAALVAGACELVLTAAPSTKGTVIYSDTPTELIVPALVLAAAMFAGDSARSRREYLAEAERRARDAERDRDQRAELAAAAERERITRELHDVIAHGLSVMVIQAQGAASAIRRDEAGEAAGAMEAIVVTGRAALAETRRVLGLIRAPGDPAAPAAVAGPAPGHAAPGEHATDGRRPSPGGHPVAGDLPDLEGLELAPQPSLADLPRLAESVRRAGTHVRLRVTGQVRPLDEGVELSAYRIVQEALTNTMRHAGPGASAEVSVAFSDAHLTIEVTDRGTGRPRMGQPRMGQPGTGERGTAHADRGQAGTGRGLAGMRARVAMLDGDLSAGPDPEGGGFRVRARLPLAADGTAGGAAGGWATAAAEGRADDTAGAQ